MRILLRLRFALLRTPGALRRGCAALAVPLLLISCAPEVGSERWCEAIRDKGPGNITANEAADYARHCVLE